MALPKLFQRIIWHNNTTPAIQEDNLNAMSKGLSDVDDRVIGLAGTIMEDVPQIQQDIEELEADMALIDTKIASATAEANRATTAANNAAASVISAGNKALVSEGWAKGTQNGAAVGSTSPYYHNNAEYFKNQARSFTPQGYQDLVDDVDSLKETFTKNGAHNLLPMTLANFKALNTSGTWSGNTYTDQGVTFAVNTDSDGNITGITANGTSTGSALFYVADFAPPLGNYIKTGCPSGGSIDTYFFGGYSGYETGTGISVSSDGSTTNTYIIAIRQNITANNLVFKPMLRLASDIDSTFEPYAMTNRELTQAVNNIPTGTVLEVYASNNTSPLDAQVEKSMIAPKDGKIWVDLRDYSSATSSYNTFKFILNGSGIASFNADTFYQYDVSRGQKLAIRHEKNACGKMRAYFVAN